MKLTPHRYQWRGAAFLAMREGAALGDEVGLGKTLTGLLAISQVKDWQRVLIVSPLANCPWWMEQVEEQLGVPVTRYEGRVGPGQYQDLSGVEGVVVAHYAQFQMRGKDKRRSSAKYAADLTKPLLQPTWDVVLLDEVHKIKNRQAQRTRMIKQLDTTYKWGLSGTLVAEKPEDIWSVLNWLDPDKFSSFWSFVNNYCQMEERRGRGGHTYKKILGLKIRRDSKGNWSEEVTLSELRRVTKPYLLVRRRVDVGIELPPIVGHDEIVPIEMADDQKAFYQEVETETLIELTEQHGSSDTWDLTGNNSLIIRSAGARFIRTQQVTSAPTTFKKGVSNAKLEWFREYLDNGGKPAVVLVRFRHTVQVVEQALEKAGAKGFIVGVYETLATGLNLQHLDTIIAWDAAPSRLLWEQAVGRIRRMGQERPQQVYRLAATHSEFETVDKRAWKNIDRKETNVALVTEWLRGLHERKNK